MGTGHCPGAPGEIYLLRVCDMEVRYGSSCESLCSVGWSSTNLDVVVKVFF